MLLDPEGQIVVARKPITAASQKRQTSGVIQAPAPGPTPDVPQSCPTHWQVKIARFRQRVQEIRMLILEYMQDLQEPLDALSNERGILSSRETMQKEAMEKLNRKLQQ